jgi:hypothetical protein
MDIRERYNFKKVPLASIRSKDWNPKTREDWLKEFDALRKDVQTHGVLVPLLVRTVAPDEYELVDGEQRYAIYKELGVVDVTVNDLGSISEQEAKALAVELEKNRIPLDFVKTSQLYADILDSVGIDEASRLLSTDRDELLQRVQMLELPAYANLPITDDEKESKALEKKVKYHIRVTSGDLEGILRSCQVENGRIEWNEIVRMLNRSSESE